MPNYVDAPLEQKPSLLERLFSPFDWAKKMAEQAQTEGQQLAAFGPDTSPTAAWLRSFAGGAHEAAGRVASSFMSPIGLASLLGGPVGEAGQAAELPALAKLGHGAATAANVGFGLQGAGEAAKGWYDESIPEFAKGVGQAALGAMGARRGLGDYASIPETAAAPSFEVETTAVPGGRVLGTKGKLSPVGPGRKIPGGPPTPAPTVPTPEEGAGPVPYGAGGYPTGSALKSQQRGIKELDRVLRQQAIQNRIDEAIQEGQLTPGRTSVSAGGSVETPEGRMSYRQSYKAPEPEETSPSVEEQLGLRPGVRTLDESDVHPVEESQSPLAKTLTAPAPQPEEATSTTPRTHTGKVLTPNQEAAERSYNDLLARIRGEGPTPAGEALPAAPSPFLKASDVAPTQPLPESTLPEHLLPYASTYPYPGWGIAGEGLNRTEGVPQELAAPTVASPLAKLFKSRVDATGQAYRDIKDLIKAGEYVSPEGRAAGLTAEEGRGAAGKGLRQEAQAAGLPIGRAAQPAPEPEQPIESKIGPQQTAKAREAALAKRAAARQAEAQWPADYAAELAEAQKMKEAGASPQDIIERMKGESGAVDPELLALLARMGVGGLAGTAVGKESGHPLIGALLGATVGAGFGARLSPESETALKGSFENVLDTANKIHNAALLSPVSVGKKFLGDVGGLSSAAIENPGRAGALARALFGGGLRQAIDVGKEAANLPPAEQEALSGAEQLASKGPLSWAGRTMSGLTAGTKNLLEQAGFSPEEQAYYTLTAEPEYGPTQGMLRAQRSSKVIQHISPFARITTNRLERGFERSPFGLPSALFSKNPEIAARAPKLATLGTLLGLGAAAATPEGFVKEHPVATGLISAVGGPYGIPIAVGMASRSLGKTPLPTMAREVTQDIPGMRTIEDITDSPANWARNYLSGYTNVLKPFAEAVGQPDPDISQHIYDRALSNVPFARETLPAKPLTPSTYIQTPRYIDAPLR